MTTVDRPPTDHAAAGWVSRASPVCPRLDVLSQALRTTDHKLIGRMYLVTSFGFVIIGGAMASPMRTKLARPGMQFLSPKQYNQLFTMHDHAAAVRVVYKSYRYGEVVTSDDPWGLRNTLERATSPPSPRHNFTSIPRIRSELPAFEYHYPPLPVRIADEGHPARGNPAADNHRSRTTVSAAVETHPPTAGELNDQEDR